MRPLIFISVSSVVAQVASSLKLGPVSIQLNGWAYVYVPPVLQRNNPGLELYFGIWETASRNLNRTGLWFRLTGLSLLFLNGQYRPEIVWASLFLTNERTNGTINIRSSGCVDHYKSKKKSYLSLKATSAGLFCANSIPPCLAKVEYGFILEDSRIAEYKQWVESY